MADTSANVVVSMPSQLFTASRSFKALSNGTIYIGKIDTDPSIPSNQIPIYIENEDGSLVQISQPVVIGVGGFPVYGGQIVKVVTVEGHSMAVYDSYGVLQHYYPNVLKYEPDRLKQELRLGIADILVEQPASKNFWIDVHPEAKVHRINDRAFFGAAALNDGKISSAPSSSTKDWMELIRPATTNNAQLAVLSTIGQGAILGASRSSDFSSAGSLGCIGGSFYGINDNTAYPQTAYGAYLEAQRFAGAGRTHGFEVVELSIS